MCGGESGEKKPQHGGQFAILFSFRGTSMWFGNTKLLDIYTERTPLLEPAHKEAEGNIIRFFGFPLLVEIREKESEVQYAPFS
jgi:hypothetical protein